MIQSAKEAREILDKQNYHSHGEGICFERAKWNEAAGYIKCLEEGPEVKALVEALEKITECDVGDVYELLAIANDASSVPRGNQKMTPLDKRKEQMNEKE